MLYIVPEKLEGLEKSLKDEVKLLLENTEYEKIKGIPLNRFLHEILKSNPENKGV